MTLATRIPEDRCRRVNLGFPDHGDRSRGRMNREEDGLLCVSNAGEVLYRSADLFGETPPVSSRTRTGAY